MRGFLGVHGFVLDEQPYGTREYAYMMTTTPTLRAAEKPYHKFGEATTTSCWHGELQYCS